MTAVRAPSRSAEIRAGLDHPVVDADGHTLEFLPGVLEYLHDEGVTGQPAELMPKLVGTSFAQWHRLSPAERARRRTTRPPWWAIPARNTLDLATAMLPRLLAERLEEMGIDFSVVYPSLGLTFPHIDDDDLRRAACRALNRYHADAFAHYADRVTPAAVIPMHTPEEAVAELEHAVGELGLKAVMIASYVTRPIAAGVERYLDVGEHACWLDAFGVDSAHDYDSVWATCVELGVSPAAHSVGMGWGSRQSVSSYVYNHLGNFAASGEALCRSLFMGGVTRRFPELRVAFLEGGVSWAAQLYSDLFGHWEKRNLRAVQHYNPANIDRAQFAELFEQYGTDLPGAAGTTDALGSFVLNAASGGASDEWAACGIERPEDIHDRFVPNFFFGCEADDPMTSSAFDTTRNPHGARLRAVLGSDIGHWDVPDMRQVLAEAYEAIEQGWLTETDFRDFTFTNPVRLYTETNPDFFVGTTVEHAVETPLFEQGALRREHDDHVT